MPVYLVLLIDSDAPLRELHNCVSECLNAVLPYLQLMGCTNLPDYAENDINTVANIARILLQDVSDVFRVIEQRDLIPPKANDRISPLKTLVNAGFSCLRKPQQVVVQDVTSTCT